MGILFKGARRVVTDYKGTLNIVTQIVTKLFEFGNIIPSKFYYQGNKFSVIISTGGIFLS